MKEIQFIAFIKIEEKNCEYYLKIKNGYIISIQLTFNMQHALIDVCILSRALNFANVHVDK